MPFQWNDAGVKYSSNPLWKGRGFDEGADSEPAGVEWARNAMHPAEPVSPKAQAAGAAAMAHWADSELTGDMAAREMQRKRGLQGHNPGMTHVMDSAAYKHDVMQATMSDPQMRAAAVERRQRAGVKNERAALDTGRAPGYRGHDAATADARAIVEDPRFAKNYSLTSGAGGIAATASAALGSKKAAGKTAARTFARALPFVGSGIAGAGAYKEHQRAKVDDAIAADPKQDALTRNIATGLADSHRKGRNKEIGSAVVGLAKNTVDVATGGASALVQGVPGAETLGGLIAGGAHGGMHVPSMPSVSAPSMPHLSAPHISQMSPPTAQDVANGIGRFGEQHQGQLEKGAWKAGSLGGGRAANKAIDWLDDKADPASLRKAAIAPDSRGRKDLQKAGVDDANAALMKLAASDGDFGNRMLAHLNADHPKLESHQAVLDAAKPQVGMLDKVKAKADRLWKRVNREKVDDVDRSPAIKPSQVARVVGGEAARQRQIDRMGETLPKMTANEDRSWWEQPAPRVRPDPAPKKK